MNDKIHYGHCPVCGSNEIKDVLTVKDYTVSGEMFHIMECTACSLRFTQDVPGQTSISSYYKSENYISHTNTSKGFINRLYQSVRKRTLVKKRKLVQKLTNRKQGNLLDVGSGTGSFADEMKQNGWQVTGLEPDEDARKVAAQLYKLELSDTNNLYQLTPASFDAITLWHVLEHVHELQQCVQQLKNLLSDNGRLFIAVPNYTSIDSAIYQQHWAAYDVPRHLYHFSPKSMAVLMEKNGLKITQHKPMWYDSFYVALLSSKYKNGKTGWFSAFFNGLRSNFKAMSNATKCSSVIYIIEK